MKTKITTVPCPRCDGAGEVPGPKTGEPLRERREAANISRDRIAAGMDISVSYLRDLEQGLRPWSKALVEGYESALEEAMV